MPPATAPGGHPARDRGLQRVLLLVLVLNLGVAAAKLVVGSPSGALSLLADSLHVWIERHLINVHEHDCGARSFFARSMAQ